MCGFKRRSPHRPATRPVQRYHIRSGTGVDGSEPPCDWKSVFGGPAWERLDDGEWYLHLFDASQPDLNWDNAEVRAEFRAIFQFWLDRGVDGFRVDVAHGLVKDPTFPDMAEDSQLLENSRQPNHPFWDRDGVHEIIREWRAVLDACGRDVMMVAEAWVHSSDSRSTCARTSTTSRSTSTSSSASGTRR